MAATMFQLRSFVHQRLYTAAEEILGEVEKTITLAMYEVEVTRSKEEVKSLRNELEILRNKSAAESSLSSSTWRRGGDGDASLLQENPGSSTPEESNSSLVTEVPGSSQTSAEPDDNNWNYSLVQTDFLLSEIKEEQEEFEGDGQTQEMVFPPSEIVKSKPRQPEAQALYEMRPISSDGSAAESDNHDSDEELVNSKGEQTETTKRKGNILQRQSGSFNEMDKRTLTNDKSPAKSEKGRSFCHFCDAQHNMQKSDGTVTAENEIILTHTPVTQTDPRSELSLRTSSPVSVQNSTWVSTFSVPWEKTHGSLRMCLAQRKRPPAADQRHMVRVIAEAIRQICLNPPFKQCAALAKRIVDEYPESFQDRNEEGEQLGNGYYTLGKQLRTRIEFLNRDNTLARLRKPKRSFSAVAENQPGPSKCGKMDSYGCVNWQPLELPVGENRESLYHKKEELKTIYSQEGQKGADQKRVNDLMVLMYELQRREINATPSPSMSDIQKHWPFLLTQKFLLQHFCTLTGIELESRLRESLAEKGKRVLHYFKSQLLKWKQEVKMVLHGLEQQMEDIDTGLAAILSMIAYFKEKEDALFLLADETSTQADIEAQVSLPSTPRLIMLGNSILGAKKWMLSIEGRVVLQLRDRADFTSALAVLFGSYYVFNIEYPEEAATSLEFIQSSSS
ncbi:uncharacterized protein [Clinocottus analis]|uniref:uncharacterized protein isoform X2 n=1 Tax=Clinocottus analis TaxID=304258 RepID=UPI0035C1900C